MQFRSFGVLARGGLRVSSLALAGAYSLVWGVAMTVVATGCSNSGEESAQNDPNRTASTSGGARSSGGEASGSSEAERPPRDSGASSTGGSRSASSNKIQTGGTRAASSALASTTSAGGSGSGSASTQSTPSTSSGGARATHTATSSAGGQTSSDGLIGGRSATGGTTAANRNVGGASVGGTSASGGSNAASSGGSSAAVTGADPFVQVWKDDFDSFDASKWELMTHSWEGNLAQFSTDNVSVASGVLSINLTAVPGDAAKPYRGVEMRSKRTLTYGKVSARIRFARGSGVVSGLVTIYTPWPADNWNEIDIEHLGKSPTSTQLNCMVYTGAPVTAPVTQSVSPTQDPLSVNLGFDAEADFHQYDIEWTPASVLFFIDGKLSRTWTKEIARMTLPQNILFTIWASSSVDWAGAVTSSTVPTSAQIDWIRVYEWRT